MTTQTPNDIQTEPKPRVSWLPKVLLLLGALLIAVLLGEGFMRVRQYVKYGTSDPQVTSLEKDPDLELSVPIAGYSTQRIQVNGMRFRGPEIEQPKPATRLRIAFLGGSTTFCSEASSNAHTWPELVVSGLRERFPKREIDFVNAAVPGYGLRHTQQRFDARVAPLQPDVAVLYHATNDISGDTRELAQAQGLWEGNVVDPSWMARHSVLWHWIEKNVEVAVRTQAARSDTNRLVIPKDEIAASFEAELVKFVASLQKRRILPVLITFSVQMRPEQEIERQLKAANTSLYYMPYMSMDGLLTCFDAYNDAIRRVGKSLGCPVIEAAHEIPGTPKMFNDAVHFTDAGCARMATVVTEGLAGQPAFRGVARLDD